MIEIQLNKSVRLDNVLIYDISTSFVGSVTNEKNVTEIEIEKMCNEIMVGGAKQIGPLIQYERVSNSDEDFAMKRSLMLQADSVVVKRFCNTTA